MNSAAENDVAANPHLQRLFVDVQPLRDQVLHHGVFQRIERLEDLRVFMEHHVFAVWDFMSLLKWLQRELTCVSVPWVPSGDPLTRRMINQIVLESESGAELAGACLSHFELYLAAMDECGANSASMRRFLARLADGAPLPSALAASDVPLAARRFVETTWALLEGRSAHAVAAAFAVGRSNVVPGMFRNMVSELEHRFPGQLTVLRHYLERQIVLDEEHHLPIALRMLVQVCDDQPEYWREATAAARTALTARVQLWEGVIEQMQQKLLGA